jgi:hypothetical protein
MAFDPQKLPKNVYEMYKIGPVVWLSVIEEAIKVQITDVTKVTDIVFYMHHPERVGKPLTKYEVALIAEWKLFRNAVRARMQMAKNSPNSKSSHGEFGGTEDMNIGVGELQEC